MRTLSPSLVIKTIFKMSRIHYIISGMRYRIVLLGEAQHFENGEVHYRTIAEIEIGRISPLDVRGMRAAQQHQQQQPPPSAEQQPQAAADPPAPQSPPAQASPLRRRRRRREHPYRPPAIIPVPLRDMTPPPSPAILPVPRPSRQRQTARMSTSQLPRILHQ